MAEKFFAIDPQALIRFLESCGFKQLDIPGEKVYVRHHHACQHLMVKVYTTITSMGVIRECGADAIRVCAIFDNGERNFGVGKFPPIHRKAPDDLSTEEKHKILFGRVYEKMRDAYKRCNEWVWKNNGSQKRSVRNR